MAKVRIDPKYRIPVNMDGIAFYVFIPRKLLMEAIPNYNPRDSIGIEILTKILQRSDYEELKDDG